MRKSSKILLGIVGSIILGALGSGLWELCLRDFCIWIGHGILSATTLGITSVRDSFYVEIAKGRTDRVGIYLVYFGFIFFGALFGLYAATTKFGRKLRSNMSAEVDRIGTLFSGFFLVFLYAFLTVRLISISYTTNAIDHYEQVYAISLPFLSAPERDQVRSDFARMKTKADYVSVLSKLQSKARDHKVDLPKFSVW